MTDILRDWKLSKSPFRDLARTLSQQHRRSLYSKRFEFSGHCQVFHIWKIRLFKVIYIIYRVPLSSTQTHFNTSDQHKDHIFSANKIPQFNTNNPSVQHRRPKNFGMELRDFWCWNDVFLVWNWGVCWYDGLLVWNPIQQDQKNFGWT